MKNMGKVDIIKTISLQGSFGFVKSHKINAVHYCSLSC